MYFTDIMAEGSEYREQVFSLYDEAFPEDEKKPRQLMEALAAEDRMELLAVVEDGRFIGLVMNMLAREKGMALLDYFAIDPERRCSGYGSRIIGGLLERFRGWKYIFEIEMQDPAAENAADRARRKAFYLRNGLKETGLFANVYHTDFELLTPDGSLTYETYLEMLVTVLGEQALKMLAPRLISCGAQNDFL